MDVIEQLGKLPGHEAEAADAKELLTLGLRLPPSWVEPDFEIMGGKTDQPPRRRDGRAKLFAASALDSRR